MLEQALGQAVARDVSLPTPWRYLFVCRVVLLPADGREPYRSPLVQFRDLLEPDTALQPLRFVCEQHILRAGVRGVGLTWNCARVRCEVV